MELTDKECEHFINLGATMGTNDMVRAIYKVAQDHLRDEMIEIVLTHMHKSMDLNMELVDDLRSVVPSVEK